MSDSLSTSTERDAIAAEQVRGYMGENNVQNLVGALVLSLLVQLAHDTVPPWTWAPGLFALYAVTVVRVVWVWFYRRAPYSASPARWNLRQTIAGGIAGLCWGGTSAAMLPYLPIELQLLVFTVITVVSATASSSGFTLPEPARAFILACLIPPTFWLMAQGDRLRVTLALMLAIFMPMTLWQTRRRNRVFIEAQRLRFRTEFLVRELAAQRDDLDLAKRRAEDAARTKSAFLANMSHEIRTPLNGVLGMAQIGFRDSAGHDKLHATFGRIIDSGKLLLGIINDILDFSKIEAGKLAVETIPFDPGRVLDDAIELTRERASGKDIALLADKSGLPATCRGDPLRLGQVLMNILANAVKFTERGSVTITTSQDADCVVFRIADTGIGMSAAQVAGLFQPFTQGDSSTTRKFGGTGLGLAITARLVELMNGTIRVDSEPGRGSVFEVSLPLLDAPAQATPEVAPKAAADSGRRLAGLRILVTEDNDINRVVVEDMLTQEGAHVVVARDGQEAVDRVRREGSAFDLVLMDVQMPTMSGFEATRRIRELAPSLPVVGQTAHALTEDRDKCLAAGMVDRIVKPIDLDELVAVVRHHAGVRPARNGARPQPIDWDELEAQYSKTPGFAGRLLHIFVENYGTLPDELRAAVDTPNAERLIELAHGLRSAAGLLMAWDLRAHAEDVETAARNDDPQCFHLAVDLIEHLTATLDAVRARRAAGA